MTSTSISPHMAEQSVLGSLMLLNDPDSPVAAKVFARVSINTFACQPHRLIYTALRQLYQAHRPMDMLTVSDQLERQGEQEAIGGLGYLADLCKNTPTARNVFAYVRLLRDHAMKRDLSATLQTALAELNDPDSGDQTLDERMNEIVFRIERLRQADRREQGTGLVHISTIMDRWLDELNDRFNGTGPRGITTGIEALDRILAPKHLLPGSLVVIGARPKVGKTAFSLTLTEHLAFNEQLGVAVFSLEMNQSQIAERLAAARARVDPSMFYRPATEQVTFQDEFARTSKVVGDYRQTHYHLDDTPGVTIDYIEAECRRCHKEHALGAVLVDYLTLMKHGKAERHDLAYGDITRRLKALAKELHGIVLLITQLNRGLEQRKNKRPLPSDSRDTGQIEQDCDVWMGLYRDRMHEEHSVCPSNLLEVIVRLNRHGGTGTAYCELNQGRVSEYVGDVSAFQPVKPSYKRDF
ncbi:replicative DNA helicase [Vibrio coralliilyticus]|uniref:replicative DNA helicase n=1 Tax=Vibrio coralliilyticus TaxID=190893 RepID=UPI0017A447E9|nr:replicative DNA helicase [Vibrio coralliilyticus]NUW66931.1 AAA family ATPase [Vibrio coralliilyticus]NUW70901.1 AAA family ATPase [Vibrio coralliilyticus]